MTAQIGNNAGGDIAGRDLYKTVQPTRARTLMTTLVESYRAEIAADQNFSSWIEKIEHYFSNSTLSDVRGLDEKLKCSDRSDILKEALAKKEDAYKLILRNQGSRTAQAMLAYLLADIVVNFEQAVRPLVQSKASRAEVDKAILQDVLAPALLVLEENPLHIDKKDIQGLLYFLGGNCHLRWDPC